MSKAEPAKSLESREQMERLRKNLLVLRSQPDIYNRCLILLDQSENALTDAIMSNDMNEKKAGIFVIVCLVEISSGEETTRVTKFARSLLKMLTNSDESVMRLASRAIAYLIQTSRTYAVELVELTLVQCSEWLEEPQRHEHRRLAAAILSRDLALFTASHFFQRATHFFNHIFKVIRDQKHNLRIAATQALHAALAVTSQRETKQKNEWYKRCFDEACVRAEHLSKDDALHASLLIFNELLRIANAEAERIRLKVLSIPTGARTRTVIGLNSVEWLTEQTYPATVESRTAKSLVTEHYFVEIVNRCMEARTSRSAQCQLVILEMFPRLVGISPTCAPPLTEMADHALHMTSKYPQALMTIGLLALHKPDVLKPKLTAMITTFHNIVQQSVSRRKPVDMMVFKGLALLVRSYPTSLIEKMRDLLPLLFATSLSKGLTEVLHEIVNCMPKLKTQVLDGLMEQLYHLLMNRAPPSKLAPPTAPPTPTGLIQVTDVRLTKLALDTLGEFEFQRHSLQQFMRFIAQGYLVCDAVEIRLAAVYCCAEITKPFVRLYENVEVSQKKEIHALIKNVLECLIKTAVVDSEVEVRLAVLKCFCKTDNEFLYHLAQKEMLDMLFMTLYDENYQMQEAAVGLLGRLSDINPAFVFPRLRRIVLENISQLINSRTPRFEEHSAKIIARLAIQCPSFVSPYMNSVLSALIPHLRVDKKNVDVSVHVLNALSELSLIGGLDIVRSIGDLFPPLITYLQDSTSLNRREAALRAMGGLCQSSAYVVDPYRDYPGLLDILLRLLKTELSVSMRRLTMKVLGIIGALDPYSHKVFLGTVYSVSSKSLALSLPITNEMDGKHDGSDIIQWINYERCTLTEFYPAIAIANLVAMLQDEALSNLHKEIVEALLRIFGSLGAKSGQYVNQVVPRLIAITETCKPEYRPFFLRQFASFASIVRLHLKPYMKRIFELIAKAWYWRDDPAFRAVVINVLEEVGKAFGSDFSPYITDLCPYLLTVVQADQAKDKALTSQALQCVKSIAVSLGAHIHLILPTILDVMDDKQVPEKVRLLAVDTVVALASCHRVAERAPTIMHSWLRCIAIKSMQDKLMALLLILMNQMWDQFLVYKESVQLALSRSKVDQDLRKLFNEQLLKIQNGPPQGVADGLALSNNRRIPNINELRGSSRSSSNNPSTGREFRHLINVDQLRTFWTAQSLTSREDWLQWLRTLRTQFIKQSPSAALRACASLADMHEPLAKELFNAAFMSVWTEIREPEQDELTRQLVDVLTLCPHAEPIQAILNLAEFMDHSEKGPLPVNYKMLSKCAEQTRAYAKALRYKELDVIDQESGEPTAEDCQALITYANKLNLEEESAGVVKYAEKRQMEISGRWYEKLGEWEKALEMYLQETSNESEPQPNDELVLHQMRCLEALGQWSELTALGSGALADDQAAPSVGTELERKQRIAQMMGRGCWAQGDYEGLATHVQRVNENSQEGSFLRAALAIKNENYKEATAYINKVRDMFDSELTAMAAESYERAYGAIVLVQQLTELEEAIEFKMMPERRTRIAVLWSRRLQGCRKDIEQWQRILIVRSLVLTQNELRPLWIKFSAMCRKQGKMSMATRVLKSLLEVTQDSALEKTQIPMDKPHLALAVCKHLWEEGKKPTAFNNLEKLTLNLHRLIECNRQTLTRDHLESMARVTAKCYLKLGEWHSANNASATKHGAGTFPGGVGRHPNARPGQELLQQGVQATPNMEQATKVLLQYYVNATTFDPTWYKAWHKLGTMYYNLVMADRNTAFGSPVPSRPPSLPNASVEAGQMTESSSSMTLPPLGVPPPVSPIPPTGVAAAADAALAAVASGASALGRPSPAPSPNAAPYQQSPSKPQTPQPAVVSVYAINAIRCFLKAIQLAEGSRLEDTLRLLMLWFDYGDRQDIFEQLRDSLKVVPVESFLEVVPQLIARLDSTQNVGLLVKQVLLDISKVHPQSLIYALTAASKSKNLQRSRVAREILESVADMRPTFVKQAQLINDELIRCAILWHEQWHEALEDASRFYFQDKNVDEMMNTLRPLHTRIEQGHTTLKEQSFNQTYYKELKDAREHCELFERTGNQKEITQAWDLYYNVFKRISQQLRQMNSLDLNYIAPNLVKAQNLEISVPGTYDPGSPLITVASIHHHLQVIMSKQRPRKVIMRGSDGKEYAFLLKGHEDPRQDERVMQLFGLINSLILRENDTCRRNLSIQRYSIIALSQSSGLIGWVPNCDTLHTLIRDYREKKKIPISEEHAKMQKLVIDIEKCTLLQKVEVFEEALRTTCGDDLRQTLWMKSPNSEVWFDRRTNYTRSMACMSMVGYILGLGDRHPSNLMLDRLSGKIVHIDFGDCFEVAMKREKYPEKIPFRLTRMLIQAMEVTGIEGNYRLTCERVLRLLRNNNDSILAVLEAFVYDPVLNWKLTDTTAKKTGAESTTGRESDAINRVKAKLSGRDFNPHYEITMQDQVSKLVEQATLPDNLCQCYIGWCPFW